MLFFAGTEQFCIFSHDSFTFCKATDDLQFVVKALPGQIDLDILPYIASVIWIVLPKGHAMCSDLRSHARVVTSGVAVPAQTKRIRCHVTA